MSGQGGHASDRRSLVAYLEAHYRRELANLIRQNAETVPRHLEQGGDAGRALQVVLEELRERVDLHEQIIMAARSVPEARLEDFLRVHTQPEWRRLMEEAGLTWDEQFHTWTRDE